MPAKPSAQLPKMLTATLDDVSMVEVLGVNDAVLALVEEHFPSLAIAVRSNAITVSGPEQDARRALDLLEEMGRVARKNSELSAEDMMRAAVAAQQSGMAPTNFLSEPILSSKGRALRPKTTGQKSYVDAIDSHTIVFGIGPAGTGKTYLAMAKAVQALERKEIDRIILTRPAVEAGERLGFLPGTLTDKIDPYLRPLFDALHEMMDPELVPKLLASGTIEVAPLAYMRGRTLNRAFIILDEAQNTSPEQMKMFLTRLGFESRMVITGDITQVDVPGGHSGLRLVGGILEDVEDIHFHYLTSSDVVRHSLVSAIVEAYAAHDAREVNARER